MIVVTTMDALPDYCYECPCNNGEHSQCEADKEKRSSFEYRPYWCPLKEVDSNYSFGTAGVMVNFGEEILGVLKEREGYVSVPFSWLVKFCSHIDFAEPLTDAEREAAWRQKLGQQFGINVPKKDGD